jgi:Response regulator containing a CheY-like receiver domain and an HTH DNA-binding domain
MRIIIAEDHPMFRSGVRRLLSTTEDLEVVGEACSGEEAVELTERLQPDLVLMDIRMPGMNGIEATQVIKERCPSVSVLMLTMYRDDHSVFAALRVGARGYVLKDAEEEELLQAIRMVGSGGAVFGTGVAERMMRHFAAQAAPSQPTAESGTGEDDPAAAAELSAIPIFEELTRREAEVLIRIARGDTNAQIAERLQISAKTVANNVSNILNKLQVIDRREARRLVQKYRLT